jgi:arylsulfatase A-like enzyme
MKLPALLSALCTVLMASIALATPAERPNILFIIVDDQSPFDLNLYNPKSTLQTPVIDCLAAEGMVFDAAHQMGAWAGGVCTPSRHMIMSGRTLWHIPDKTKPGRNPLSADPKYVPADLSAHTMAAVFNAAGYDTMRTCKTGNSYAAANKRFTVRREASKRGGTDETGSAWHAQQVLDYLDQRQADDDPDPFLIYFGFSHPHDVRDGKPDLLAKYGAVNHKDKSSLPTAHPRQPRLPAAYLPAHPFNNTDMKVRDEVAVSGVWSNRGAGIKPRETMEGISFRPVLEGRTEVVRETLYGAYCGGAKPGIRCVKKGDWKLIRYESPGDGVNETQLFNLAKNPEELLEQHHDPSVIALTGNTPKPNQRNLAGDPQHAVKLEEMESLLLGEMRRHNDPYRFSNQPAE